MERNFRDLLLSPESDQSSCLCLSKQTHSFLTAFLPLHLLIFAKGHSGKYYSLCQLNTLIKEGNLAFLF